MIKRLIQNTFKAFGYAVARLPSRGDRLSIPEVTPNDVQLMRGVDNFTMTSMANRWALVQAIRYLNAARIEGDIVECGVWRGGSMILAKLVQAQAPMVRKFILFDTFAGMTMPQPIDLSYNPHESALRQYMEGIRATHNEWAYSSLEEVISNFRSFGALDENVFFRPGLIEKTLREPGNVPERIALLRLDTDWYASTKIELEVLYPRLSIGGILMVDDYGHWKGARQAVDEYFADAPQYLMPVDYSCRVLVKR